MRRAFALTVLLLCLAAPPAARSADLRTLYDEYLQLGSIAACNHSAAELEGALGSIPADIAAYDPGFELALNTALEQRASGCSEALREADQLFEELTSGASLAPDGSPGPPPPPLRAALAPPEPPDAPSAGIVGATFGAAFAAGALFVFFYARAGRHSLRGRGRSRFHRAGELASDVAAIARQRLLR